MVPKPLRLPPLCIFSLLFHLFPFYTLDISPYESARPMDTGSFSFPLLAPGLRPRPCSADEAKIRAIQPLRSWRSLQTDRIFWLLTMTVLRSASPDQASRNALLGENRPAEGRVRAVELRATPLKGRKSGTGLAISGLMALVHPLKPDAGFPGNEHEPLIHCSVAKRWGTRGRACGKYGARRSRGLPTRSAYCRCRHIQVSGPQIYCDGNGLLGAGRASGGIDGIW